MQWGRCVVLALVVLGIAITVTIPDASSLALASDDDDDGKGCKGPCLGGWFTDGWYSNDPTHTGAGAGATSYVPGVTSVGGVRGNIANTGAQSAEWENGGGQGSEDLTVTTANPTGAWFNYRNGAKGMAVLMVTSSSWTSRKIRWASTEDGVPANSCCCHGVPDGGTGAKGKLGEVTYSGSGSASASANGDSNNGRLFPAGVSGAAASAVLTFSGGPEEKTAKAKVNGSKTEAVALTISGSASPAPSGGLSSTVTDDVWSASCDSDVVNYGGASGHAVMKGAEKAPTSVDGFAVQASATVVCRARIWNGAKLAVANATTTVSGIAASAEGGEHSSKCPKKNHSSPHSNFGSSGAPASVPWE